LRLGGTEVTHEVREPIVGYVGDSSPEGLDNNPVFFEAKILICELTFVAPGHRRQKIHKFGHMHLDDFVERQEMFKNELVIAAHLSTRYHAKGVEQIVAKRLPDALGGRLHLWL
jgi:ribonuclease Z